MPDVPDNITEGFFSGRFPGGDFNEWIETQSEEFQADVDAARSAGVSEEWIAVMADQDFDLSPADWESASLSGSSEGWEITMTDEDGNVFSISLDQEDASDLLWGDLYDVWTDNDVEIDKSYSEAE